MANLRKIFARHLKETRKQRGFSQEKLAEKAGVSTHHIAMIELCRSFPTIELMERLADALDIAVHQLLIDPDVIDDEPGSSRKALIDDIRQTVEEAVENAFAKRDCKPPAGPQPPVL